jgi:nicotinate-nucleotide adenylyltransferase
LAELRSVGILGGTFNPPHLGHLALARHARVQLALERVLLMPAHGSPHKSGAEDPGPGHRLRMCGLLVADAPGVSVCALELTRGGPSYTVDTLQAIHASHRDVELTFILGADTASTLPAWREPGKLLELARFAIAARAGSARTEVLETFERLRAGSPAGPRLAGVAALSFLEMPVMDVSSSTARGRAARGEPIDDLVGGAVAQYIAANGLYRAPGEALR